MSTGVHIGRVTADDYDGLAALAQLRGAWVEEEQGEVEEDDAFIAAFLAWARAEDRVFFLARGMNGEPAGMCNLAIFRRMPKPGGPPSCWAYLANMFVGRQHRRTGVGVDLVAVAVDHARAVGAVRLVASPSDRSHSFYARQGFSAADGLVVLPLA